MWEKSRSDIYQYTIRVAFAGQVNKAGISSAPMALYGTWNWVMKTNFQFERPFLGDYKTT